MSEEGKSLTEIRNKIDDTYGGNGTPTPTPMPPAEK
ncbi:hypothetical protein CHM34_11120 [Paludifilum halophilum]|uniref:Uncharacterized protein n=3 Tax=Paludifilum halophilum TaxID=1642702 RepID=A0A235B564_9BACL|nr:hypothetical protein CHM34_11120 [Paludifilum halophilum]